MTVIEHPYFIVEAQTNQTAEGIIQKFVINNPDFSPLYIPARSNWNLLI